MLFKCRIYLSTVYQQDDGSILLVLDVIILYKRVIIFPIGRKY